jgi:S-formylglutathione hydrolase FrmB
MTARDRLRVPLVAALAAVLAAAGAGAAAGRLSAPRPAAAATAAPADVEPDVSVLELPSPDAAGHRDVWVYRPPGVPDSAALPVLYLLHGYPDTPASVFGGLAAQASLGAFQRSGGRPFVVVAPDGNGAGHPDTEWADSVDGADRVETFLTTVVIPAVEGTHRRDAAHRAIAGYSMGGYGAMNLALRHPDLFGQVAALSGYFRVDDPDGVFGGRPDVEAANSPDRRVAAARGRRVLLSDGDRDEEPVTRGETQRFAALLRAAGIPYTLHVRAGGRHDSAYVRAELPVLWAFLAAGWAAPAGR